MTQSTILAGIERKAEWLKQDSQGLCNFVGALATRPWFETRAENAMALAEQHLIAALETVRACRAAYDATPRDALPSFMQAAE